VVWSRRLPGVVPPAAGRPQIPKLIVRSDSRHPHPRPLNRKTAGRSSCHRGSSISAQAASHNVLTVTRMLLRARVTGGQNQKLPLPS
jgi:hypothetical protein